MNPLREAQIDLAIARLEAAQLVARYTRLARLAWLENQLLRHRLERRGKA